jgi:hypothetical protein
MLLTVQPPGAFSEPQPQKGNFRRGQPDFALAGIGLEPLDGADRVEPILCRESPNSRVGNGVPRPHRRGAWPSEIPFRDLCSQ